MQTKNIEIEDECKLYWEAIRAELRYVQRRRQEIAAAGGYLCYLKSLSPEAFRKELSDEFYGQLESEIKKLEALVSDWHCTARSFYHSPLYDLRAFKRGYWGSIDWLMRTEVAYPKPRTVSEARGQFQLTFLGFRRVKFRLVEFDDGPCSHGPNEGIAPEWPRRSGEMELIVPEC